jgi:hypothetical protein
VDGTAEHWRQWPTVGEFHGKPWRLCPLQSRINHNQPQDEVCRDFKCSKFEPLSLSARRCGGALPDPRIFVAGWALRPACAESRFRPAIMVRHCRGRSGDFARQAPSEQIAPAARSPARDPLRQA